MNKLILSVFSVIFIFSCNSSKEKQINGTYKALYFDTFWELTLGADNNFIFTAEGHIGDIKRKGTFYISGDTIILNNEFLESNKFLINGDSCLIDIENRYDYCKKRTNDWGSRLRDINYPQLPTDDKKMKNDVEWMIQTALNNKRILEFIPDTIKPLIIQEYYEITKTSNLNIKWNGESVKFLSEQEIKDQKIEKYIIIDDINLGLKTAMVDFKIMPNYWFGTLSFFKKENGSWFHYR